MNILLIENQPLADMIRSKRTDIDVYGGLGQSVEVVAADIKSRLAEHYDVIIIGVHAQIGNALLSDHAGIQLLKLLRLHHIDKHVVLYSWMSREMLMGNLRNAIVFSKGVTFYRLPDFINEVKDLDFDKLSLETADKNELLPLFRAEYDPNERHFDANMFGVWQLMRVQDAYEKMYEGGVKQSKDEEGREIVYAYLNSYNGKVMQYISGQYSENLEDRLLEETKRFSEKARKERLQYAESSIKAVDAELHDVQIRIEAINKLIPVDSKRDEGTSWLQRKVEEMANKKLTRLAMDETQELVQRKVELEKERQHFESMKVWAETPADSSTESDELIKFDNVTIAGIKNALNERRPRIVYVDDMADKGWVDMLKRMVYKNEEDYGNLVSIVPGSDDSVDDIVSRINSVQKPDLIILDLRLKDEKGYYAPADLSGFQVLERLNKGNLPCAILVFTASNKVWSLKEAFKGNVMSFWTKGGLDNMDKTNDGVNNYLDLLCQINYLTDYKWLYGLLAKIGNAKQKIDSHGENTYWWETEEMQFKKIKKTKNGVEKEVSFTRVLTDRGKIIQFMSNVLQTTQSDLRQMFFFDNGENAKNLMLKSFVMRLTDILEEIFYYEGQDKYYITLTDRIKKFAPKDRRLWHFRTVRNNCAHNGYLRVDTMDVVRSVAFVLDCIMPMENKCIVGGEIKPTPLEDRTRLLEEGNCIIVEVLCIKPYSDKGWFYNFYLNEKRELTGVLLYSNRPEHANYIEEIEEGDFIVVKPNGATSSGKKRFTICCLYKNSDFIDDEDVMEEEELDYEMNQDEHEPDLLTE